MTVHAARPRVERLDALLAEYGTPVDGQERAALHPCQGTKFHSPVPLTTRQFADPACTAWLCPTCTSKLEIFIHIYDTDPAALSWDVMREFGNQIRIFGQAIVAAREAGAHA